MRLKKKKMLGIILSLVLVLGLMPGISMTVEAASYTISPENSGTVSAANGVYTAVPNSGYDFDHWEYDYGIASSSTENPKDFSHYALTGPVKAVFVKQRAKATVTANSFTYDGDSHDLVSVSNIVGGTVKYKAADGTWTETIPSGTAAGSYTVTYKIFSTDSEYDDSLEKSVTATIAKATASANVTANALSYNGSAQELVSVSDLVGGTVNYLKEEKTSAVYTSGSVNTSALEVGDIVAPATNNSVSFEGTVLFTGSGYYSSYNGKTFTSIRSENMFEDEEMIRVEGPDARIYFHRDYNALRVISVADGNVYVEPFAYTSTQTYTNKVWTEEIPVGTNVGSYSVTYKIVSNDSNYADSGEDTIDDITISKAAPTVTAPTATNPIYTGAAQDLITAGSTTGGEMQYALGTKDAATEEYTTSIPTATDAGTYYVWYKVVGDDNLNNSEAEKVTVTISQLSIKNATVSLDKTDLVYTGSEQSAQVSSVKIGETVLKANSDYEVSGTTGTNKGDYTVTVTGKGNYKDVVTSKWNIAMATPVIDVLPSASAITYGQSLADSTLTEGTAKLGENVVEGTFSWKNDATKPVVSDSEKTEYVVVFTPNDAENLNTVECKVKVTVNKAIAGVAKAPTANTLIYNGKAQVLVKAGEATDGIMNYAIGKDDKTAPAEGWNTSIPTATGAGTYYVWYKVVGDSNHLDSDAGYVTVTIAPADSSDSGSGSTSSGSTDSGSGDSSGDSSDNTNTDTDTSAKVPYEDVAISTGSVKDITGTAAATAEINPFGTKIENNSNLTTLLSLTDAEVAQGVNVWLDVQDMSASVPQTDKTLIQNTSGDYTVGLYLDINLFKKVGSNDATKVTETNGKVKASIVIPESLWKSGRIFEIIRVHDGVATAIAGTYDENTHVFTFETDKFSTYALAYKDPASSSDSTSTSDSNSSNSSNSTQSTAPKTGDLNDIRVWYLLLIASLGGLGFLGYSKKKKVND